MKDESHWLLERPSKSVSRATYFSGFTSSCLSVNFDHNRALKFGSREEAEAFANRNGLVDWEPQEHLWCYPKQSDGAV